MKIFFYSHTLCPGGAEKQCAMIAAEIKKRYGYESTVILNWKEGAKQEYVDCLNKARVSVIVLPHNPVLRVYKLFGLFCENKRAVLFNYLTYPDFVGGFCARLAGLKRVVGGIETDRMFGYKFLCEKISHRFFSERTICNSQKAFEFFSARGFEPKRMFVMPSAIAMTPDRIIPNRNHCDKVCIVTVGRFTSAKDYETWVKVIAQVYRQNKNVRAKIVGYGEQESMVREQISSLGLEAVVQILPGQCTDVGQELGMADIYLSTSLREGVSNSILEAMDMALPIVATNVGDNARMIEDGASGFICPVKDVAKLSTSLLELIQDADLRRNFGARSREIVAAKYSLEKIASDYDELIESLK